MYRNSKTGSPPVEGLTLPGTSGSGGALASPFGGRRSPGDWDGKVGTSPVEEWSDPLLAAMDA